MGVCGGPALSRQVWEERYHSAANVSRTFRRREPAMISSGTGFWMKMKVSLF